MNLNNIPWFKKGAIALLVESYSSTALTIQIRGATENEQIIADHSTSSDRSLATSSIDITSVPFFLTARATATGVKRGSCFVRVSITVEGVVIAVLFADYVTDTSVPVHPYGTIKSSLEGPGLLRSITGTDPAANTEISETVPTGALWRLISFSAAFVTDANVATRAPILRITDGANILSSTYVGVTIAASTTARITFANYGQAITAAASAISGTIYDNNLLQENYIISTATGSLQVGDNYGAPQLLVEEWINP